MDADLNQSMQGQNDSTQPPMGAKDYSEANDWPGYFGAVLGQGARETLVLALDRFAGEGASEGFAVDLAAGEGRDTLELLRRGWRVLATDSHPEAFTHLWPRVPAPLHANLRTVKAAFSATEIPDCDLVNASYALPFCEAGDFDGLWRGIVTAIRPGGRFAGQFFGKRDTWAARPDRTHHSREEILKLLEAFDIELMDEEESDDEPDVRNPKHWHMFHVVAKKR